MNKKNKKGIVFSLTAIVISGLIIAVFFYANTVQPDKEIQRTKTRIKTLNQYNDQLENYIEMQTRQKIRKGIQTIVKKMMNEDAYTTEPFEIELKNCLEHGKYNVIMPEGTDVFDYSCVEEINGTLTDSIETFEEIAGKELNIESETIIEKIELKQDEPWKIKAKITTITTTGTEEEYAIITKHKTQQIEIPIEGLPDPTNAIGLTEKTQKNIDTPEMPERWTGESVTNLGILNDLVANQHYFFNPGAPSYIDRINNRLDKKNETAGISYIVLPSGIQPGQGTTHLDNKYYREQCETETQIEINDPLTPEQREAIGSSGEKAAIEGMRVPKALFDNLNIKELEEYYTETESLCLSAEE